MSVALASAFIKASWTETLPCSPFKVIAVVTSNACAICTSVAPLGRRAASTTLFMDILISEYISDLGGKINKNRKRRLQTTDLRVAGLGRFDLGCPSCMTGWKAKFMPVIFAKDTTI